MLSEIITDDALHWLEQQPDRSLPHVFCGPPDMEEIKTVTTIDEYDAFIKKLVRLILSKVREHAFVLFMCTDRKINSKWYDKSHAINTVADELKVPLLFHKIVLNRDEGKVDLFRPTYQHLLCFSKWHGPGRSTPDVLSGGGKLYRNGTPIKGAEFVLQFLKDNSKLREIVEPCCGRASFLREAQRQGFDVKGVEIDEHEATLAKCNLDNYYNGQPQSKCKKIAPCDQQPAQRQWRTESHQEIETDNDDNN